MDEMLGKGSKIKLDRFLKMPNMEFADKAVVVRSAYGVHLHPKMLDSPD